MHLARNSLYIIDGPHVIYFQVHCQLPEGLTKVGEPIEIKADNCSDPHCFVHEIPYSAADLIQIQHLMDKSAGCSQEIQVKCLSAPMQVINSIFFKRSRISDFFQDTAPA